MVHDAEAAKVKITRAAAGQSGVRFAANNDTEDHGCDSQWAFLDTMLVRTAMENVARATRTLGRGPDRANATATAYGP